MTLSLCGDVCQSIYLWRTSNYNFLLNFHKLFPNIKSHTILKNYRTPKQLVELANEFRKTFVQHGIEYTPSVPHLPDMQDVLEIRGFETSIEEIDFISREIKRLHRDGVPYSRISVLCRANKMLTDMESGLIAMQIPYYLKYDSGSVMRQSPFRFIYSLYSLILNPSDILSFCELILPLKGIGDKFLEKVKKTYAFSSTPVLDFITPEHIKETGYQRKLVFQFIHDFVRPAIQNHQKGMPFNTFNRLLLQSMNTSFNYEDDKNQEFGKLNLGVERGQFLKAFSTLQNIYFIATEDQRFSGLSYWEQFQQIYENIQLSQDSNTVEKNGEDVPEEKEAVGLHTIHSYKGKENDYIYFAQVNPLSSMDGLDFENRCVFYVAITRSRRKLTITCSQSLLNYENRLVRSFSNPFLEELIGMVNTRK